MTLPTSSSRHQHGATLVVGLIMLALITLTVTTAFTLSSTNLRSVGNMQSRNEAVAAANSAIEQVLSSPFTNAPAAEQINIDIDRDNKIDYIVDISAPVCIRASPVPASSSAGGRCSISIDPNCAVSSSEYNTVWDIEAVVTDANSGTSVRVHQGVRERLSQDRCDAVCAPTPATACS
jgi:Tfp pilus assembly protein PilX